jgi:outer membrane protein
MTRLRVAALVSVMALSAPIRAQEPPAPAAAQPAAPQMPLRMAFIDLQLIAAESAEGKASNTKIQALTQKRGTELQEKTKALKAQQDKLQQGGAALNDAARTQTQKEIERLTVDIERFQQDANAEVTELQQELQTDFQEKLRPIVDAVIKELKIGLLFSRNQAGDLYVDPSLDITEEVIKRFDSSKGAAPAAVKPAPTAKPTAAPPATQKPAAPTSAAPPPTAPPAKP